MQIMLYALYRPTLIQMVIGLDTSPDKKTNVLSVLILFTITKSSRKRFRLGQLEKGCIRRAPVLYQYFLDV